MTDFFEKSVDKTITTKAGAILYEEFSPKRSKQLLDDIDAAIAVSFGIAPSQLDYIINYDIKYRMGKGGDDDGDD